MTAQTLPDDPVYAFVPSYDLPDQPQQNRGAATCPTMSTRSPAAAPRHLGRSPGLVDED